MSVSKELRRPAEPSKHMARLPDWFNKPDDNSRIIEFYTKFTKDFEKPLWAGRVEVPELHAAGLLFVPHHDDLEAYHWPWSLQEHNVSVYQQGRFVADSAQLLPKYLSFMKGVINFTDEAAAEALRGAEGQARLRAALTDSCFGAFAALERSPVFAQFHAAFMPHLREGVHEEPARREQIARLCRFRLSGGGERWFSLDECADRCGGREIPFAVGCSRADIASLPAVRALEAEGRQVVYVLDPPFDAHFLCALGQWRGARLRPLSPKRAEAAAAAPHARAADDKTRGGMVKIGGQFPAGEQPRAAPAEQPAEPMLFAGGEAAPRELEQLPAWASGADAEAQASPGRLHALARELLGHERCLLSCAFVIAGDPACTGFIFIPHHDTFSVFGAGDEAGSSVRLYSDGRFVADLPTLLPKWLRFLKCAVSVAGPLPAELLRSSAFQQRVAEATEELAFRCFHSLAHAPNRLTYNQFHGAFAPRLRLALHDRPQRREQIAALLRFHSSRFPEEPCVSLDDYLARMPLEQHAIYFAVGKTSDDIASLPAVRELVKSKGFEVLFAWDPPFSKTCMVEIGSYRGRDLVPLLMAHEGPQHSPRAARLEGALIDQKLLKQERAGHHGEPQAAAI